MNTKTLAFCLGDGHLSKDGKISVTHCAKQLEYLQYKAEYFHANIYYKNNNGYDTYLFEKGVNNRVFGGKEIRKYLYGVLGHKYYSKYIVDNMDLYCFAILYLDDGSLCAKKRNGKIHAYDLTISIYGEKTECEYLIDKLKNEYDIQFTLKFNKGKYSIRCGTQNAKKFLELIRPLIPEFQCFKETKLKHI